MKTYTHALLLAASVAATLALGGCLQYDMPGDNFRPTEQNMEVVTRRGAPDSIDYRATHSTEEVASALHTLSPYILTAAGGQYGLRGGGAGNPPIADYYQFLSSLCVDVFSGYLVASHSLYTYGKFDIPTSYYIESKCYSGTMDMFQTYTAAALVPLLNHELTDLVPELKAMALLLFDFGAMDVANVYGPMPLQDIKTNRQNYPFTYQPLSEIYDIVAGNLDTIAACFAHYPSKPLAYRQAVGEALGQMVHCFGQSWEGGFVEHLDQPLRFANSLKLRLAMHVSRVAPDKARRWAEEAVRGGVVEERAHEVAFWPNRNGFMHPLAQLVRWHDTCLSGAFEVLLRHYAHPFLHTAFGTNTGAIHRPDGSLFLPPAGGIVGILAGTEVGASQSAAENEYIYFSSPQNIEKAPMYLMKLAEVCFLRAEGAVRGWDMGGRAAEFYEQGVRAGNFAAPGCGMADSLLTIYDRAMDAYLAQDHARPITYRHPKDAFPPMESEISVGVKWNEADAPETKLEKISTQKYIALYPESFEAWVEIRRTGYPRLLPVQNVADADGSLQPGDLIRRLPFPFRLEQAVQQDIQRSAIPALGGEDKVGTRLWWDIPGPAI